MKCVILAAGIAKRLRPMTLHTPKCLLMVQGKSLLVRLLENIQAAGIRDIALVTGFQVDKIRSEIKRNRLRGNLTFIRNPWFRSTNNAFSLFKAREYIGTSPLLLLDGDLVFGRGVLESFLAVKRRPNRLAVRVHGSHDEEEIRVRINRWDHIREIGKDVPLKETYGESVGIGVFSAPATLQLFRILEHRIRNGSGKTEFYESAFQEMIGSGTRLWAVDIEKAPIMEIDTLEDLSHAQIMKLS